MNKQTNIEEKSRKLLGRMVRFLTFNGLEKKDAVLIMMEMDTPEKIVDLYTWVDERVKEDKLMATPIEVMNEVARIRMETEN